MKATITRGRPGTSEAWIVDLAGVELLFTFTSLRRARLFIRLVRGGTQIMNAYMQAIN